MTAPTILWYVHDHGRGHLERARAVLPHLRAPAVVAVGPGLADEAARVLDVPVVALSSDTDGDGDAPPPHPFHHAPTGPTLRRRMGALAAAAAEYGCTTAVVDVSIETVVWARLHGLRVVAVRQSGRRTDPGHRLAWAHAHAVLVPQHEALEPIDPAERDGATEWVFTGAFSRLDGDARPGADGSDRRVVVLPGSGGSSMPDRWGDEPAAAGWSVAVAGADAGGLGFVDDLGDLLRDARFAIASAGWGSVADAVSVGCPLVLVTEPRPFAEQAIRTSALGRAGLAVVLDRWPMPADLDALAATVACQLGDRAQWRDRWRAYYDGRGADRAAALIDEVHQG